MPRAGHDPPSGSEASFHPAGSEPGFGAPRWPRKAAFLNPVPINSIAERWISKFEAPRLKALSELKRNLEGKDHG
jgi:hypothetical protein